MTVQQVAIELGVSRQQAWRYIRDGRLQARSVDGFWWIEPEAVAAMRAGDGTLTVPEAAKRRGVSRIQMWRDVRAGRVKGRRVRGKWRIALADLTEFVPGRRGRPGKHASSS